MQSRNYDMVKSKICLPFTKRDNFVEQNYMSKFIENNRELETAEKELLAYLCYGRKKAQEAIKILIEIFANHPDTLNINRPDNLKHTALFYATKRWPAEIVKALLEFKPDINVSGQLGNTPLMNAVYNPHPEQLAIIKDLIEHGADLNLKNIEGNTILHLAVNEKKEEIISYLTSTAKADLDAQNNDGNTPLLCSINTESISASISLKLIEAGADVNKKNNAGETALFALIKNQQSMSNKIQILNALLEHQANIDTQLPNGKTALMLAVESQISHDIAQELIKAGASLECQDNTKSTALMHAAKNGRIESVNSLIEAGANLDLQDNQKNTALMLAIEYGQKKVALQLIEQGANLDLQNSQGKTALIIAAEKGETKIMELLFMKGADIQKQTNEQKTAVDYAIKQALFPQVKSLVSQGAMPKDPGAFLFLCAQHDTQALSALNEISEKMQSHYRSVHQQAVNKDVPGVREQSNLAKISVFGGFSTHKHPITNNDTGNHFLRKSK